MIAALRSIPRFWALFGVGVVASGLWLASNMSPTALWSADAELVRGNPHLAAERYDAIAKATPFPYVRAQALERAAQVYGLELERPDLALQRWSLRLLDGVSGDDRAVIHTEQAALLVEDWRFHEAALAFEQAWKSAPHAEGAWHRLASAARLHASHGRAATARSLFMRLADRHPEQAGHAAVGRAELLLREGDAHGALSLYEEAETLTNDVVLQAHARLGAATCLERLGNLDEALAAIDMADLPGDVLDARREGILSRRDRY
jgi:tetratricopeptide (TPR) repeat protein